MDLKDSGVMPKLGYIIIEEYKTVFSSVSKRDRIQIQQ